MAWMPVGLLAGLLAGLLVLVAGFCLLARDLWRACVAFVVFALLMSATWLQLDLWWLALAELVLGALLTGGTLLWTLRGRGRLPRLARRDDRPGRHLLITALQWLLALTWLGLLILAMAWPWGGQVLLAADSAARLFALVGAAVITFALWAFGAHHHLLRRLLAFNLVGSGVFLVLAGLAGPGAETQALLIVGLLVGLLGTVLGSVLLLRLHALTGQVELAGARRDAA